jgi:heparan-alpha-glucosaminide N-acetyltransferase
MDIGKDPTPPPAAPPTPTRLLSLDAYRGFIMLLLSTSAFQIHKVAPKFPESAFWKALSWQFGHREWRGCSFWDLIQPSFMFMVGVAVPYSYAARRAKGDSDARILVHGLWRSLVLVLLGVFLSSNGSKSTQWTFVNVLSQIGLGYAFVSLFRGRPVRAQLGGLALLLAGTWLAYVLYPAPSPDYPWAAVGVTPDVERYTGLFSAHFNKNANLGHRIDLGFLNLFPQMQTPPGSKTAVDAFLFNAGGYPTINFIPSLATMAIGLMAGELLRGPRSAPDKLKLLAASGVACLLIGIACDPAILPFMPSGVYSLCPIVKKLWTPSFALFAGGWTLLMLAAFYAIVDIQGRRAWTFPFVVVGANSIAMYCLWQLFKGWALESVKIHAGRALYESAYGPVWASLTWTAVLWGICFWMYRRKIFLKV